MNKAELCRCLDQAIAVIEKINLGETDLLQKLKGYKSEASLFQAKIPFIGSYSVGKSALINAYLGDDEILQEDINPQTALATEVRFGTEEHVDLIKEDGSTSSISLEASQIVSVEGVSKMIYYLNREQLKKLQDLIIVDMPGFNSGIEAHNRAIYEYLGEAAAYVFVTSVEQGTLTQPEIDFLTEVKSHAPTVKYVINKCDKVIPKVTENVKNEISRLVEGITGTSPDIMVTSSRRPECGQQIETLLSKFSSDRLLMMKLGPDIRTAIGTSIQCVKIKKSANFYNPHELNVYINELNSKKELLEQKFELERKKLHIELQEKVVSAVLKDVERTLVESSSSMVSSAMVGQDKLSATINNLVRPVLVNSVQKNVELSMDGFLDTIYKDLSIDLNMEGISKGVNLVKNGLDQAIAFTTKNLDKFAKYQTLYKAVSATLAVTTAYIAPVIEIVIIFLPEIVSFINKIFSSSREEEIESKIVNEVIPSICRNLHPQLKEKLSEIESKQLEKISDQLKSSIANIISSISSAESEIQKNKDDIAEDNRKLDKAENELSKIFKLIDMAIA